MKVCYFGTYNTDAARNRTIIKGLRQNGLEVIECNSQRNGITKYIDLLKKHRSIKGTYDAMVVGFPGFKAVVLARFLTRKPVFFDVFVSLYDSIVWDRREIKTKSLKALVYWITDWISCMSAHRILLDTNKHIEYFAETFHIPKEKFMRVFVGTDDTVFKQARRDHDMFTVHFHGTYIPLQGIEYIVAAAKKLENEPIKFNIVGGGQTQERVWGLAKELEADNVHFLKKVPYEKLNDMLNESDIALGIFGDTQKAKRVIPNKLYEALASGIAVITGESDAAKELLTDRENVLFCKMADGNDLAEKILELKNDPKLREKIAREGRRLFEEKLTPKKVTEDLAQAIKRLK